MDKRCNMCGRPLKPEARFCAGCGAPVDDRAGSPAPGPVQSPTRRMNSPQPPARGRTKLIARIAIAVALLALLAAAAIWLVRYREQAKLEAEKAARIERQEALARRQQELLEEERQRRLDSIAAVKKVRQAAYDGFVEVLRSNKDNLYDSGMAFAIADITGDHFPELIVQTGHCEVERQGVVYEGADGQVRRVGEINLQHSYLAKGDGYLVSSLSMQGVTMWFRITYDGSSLSQKKIYEHQDYDWYTGEEMPGGKELREPALQWFGYSDTYIIRSAVGL